MSHFAHITESLVDNVIVVEQDALAKGQWGNSGEWVQTSYNTRGGVHLLGGEPMRKNFAGIGYGYDKARDAFIPPQRYPLSVLNEDTCLWEGGALESV